MSGDNLSFVTECKYLGLVITSNLRWISHITYIKNKVMKKV